MEDTSTTRFPAIVPNVRKGFIYRASNGGRRLYFSENEIKDVLPRVRHYLVVLHTGATFQVRSSVPDEVTYEAPVRESVKGDYYYKRS